MAHFEYFIVVFLCCLIGASIGFRLNKRSPIIIGLSIAMVMPIGWVFLDGSALFLIATPIFALVLGLCQRHKTRQSAGLNH